MKAQEFLETLENEGINIDELSSMVVDALNKKGLKIATAESCTGGMISSLITDISGSSSVFDCGVCTYANHIKHKLLGVKEETLSTYGAVSEKTAMEMARGVRLLSNANIGISTTGIAGPMGGSQYKPVGLVYIGISTKEKLLSHKVLLCEGREPQRRRIRELASACALYFALHEIDEI
ncbi:MAG: CinA family protein [Ruminococcaceae bacterium]|nr:CinA family protein [Oscillospiraceae bacterium]